MGLLTCHSLTIVCFELLYFSLPRSDSFRPASTKCDSFNWFRQNSTGKPGADVYEFGVADWMWVTYIIKLLLILDLAIL
jgi:hypothetical protein